MKGLLNFRKFLCFLHVVDFKNFTCLLYSHSCAAPDTKYKIKASIPPAATRHGDFIKVPDLIGKNIQEFESELIELDLQYVISDSGNYNPEYKVNSVLDQLPKANAKVKQGRKIYLTLNASDFEMVQIPKITRITARQARKTIESLGFVFGEIEYVDDIARDEVISISHDGKELSEGDFLKRTSRDQKLYPLRHLIKI